MPLKNRFRGKKRKLPPLQPPRPVLTIPCGCRINVFNHHGIIVTYCRRHRSFYFSPRWDGTDVFYFVTEENQP